MCMVISLKYIFFLFSATNKVSVQFAQFIFLLCVSYIIAVAVDFISEKAIFNALLAAA